ncbi:MAG: insulinase family protein [Clostridia bacterium]|nr:insulinase family protein [Clostridia bacterium]
MSERRKFTAGEVIDNFAVKRVRESRAAGGNFVEFEHVKTGTELVFCDNGEENKLFCVAFKTLPGDDTGVFHILEHSVLCGSGKFPVKEPFVDMLKSSMNTFLNAITYQDKTVYPVSSRNSKDFLNLTEVYLDAVFDPAILTNPNIFYQEGHHIEQDEEGNLSYKGVVFNEMKGALSDVDDLVYEKTCSLLFPGSPYGVNSGGDPEHIPELTYVKFIETYKKFYHPSNARIFIDGDIPLEKTLSLIDSYLSRFDRSEKIADPDYSASETRSGTIKYELPESESSENRGILTLSRIIGTWKDKLKCMAANVLADALLGNNFAPLKSKVLESGLAQDIYMYTDNIVLQPYSSVQCRNIADGKAEELKKLICDTAAEIAEKGIDRDVLLSSVSRYEFNVREQEEPRALRRALMCLTGWLHDGDPLKYIEFDEDFAALREMAENGGFEALLKEILSDGDGLVTLLALPDYKEGERLRNEEKERLAKVSEAWNDEDREALGELNRKLTEWQQTPDSPEATATIPLLELSDVDPEPSIVPTEVSRRDGVTLLYHKVPANGIYYVNMYFNLSDFTLDELTVVSRAGLYFGSLPTEKHDVVSLQNEIKKRMGRFDVWTEAKTVVGEDRRTTPMLVATFSALESEFAKAAELAAEILTTTKFDGTARIKELVLQNDEGVKQIGVNSGHSLGILASLSRYTSAGAVAEAVSGRSMIMYSHKLAEDFGERVGELRTVFSKLKASFTKERLVLSLSGTDEPDAGEIIGRFPSEENGAAVPENALYKADIPEKLGLTIPAQIGYAVQGFNYFDIGEEFKGSFLVASQIVSLDYLWNAVRVQGGAYGAGISVGLNGNIFTYSYRDPSPAASIEVNKNICSYLRSLKESGAALDKYIISSMNEPLLSVRRMAAAGDNNWFAGLTPDIMRRHRREGLGTNWDDIERFCRIMEQFCEKGAVCVVAYKDALDKCEELEIKEL